MKYQTVKVKDNCNDIEESRNTLDKSFREAAYEQANAITLDVRYRIATVLRAESH